MCLIAFAIRASSRWPLVIAANRDESLDRPTAPLSAWSAQNGQTILSGRDLRDGGTWLGVSGAGRVAMLTNVRRGFSVAGALSRGELVRRWLEGEGDFAAFASALDLQRDAGSFGGFNLVTGDLHAGQWNWGTNADGAWCVRALDGGIYGLSNAALDTPWPKLLALKAALARSLDSTDHDSLDAALLPPLLNRQIYPPELLPETGIDPAREAALSAAFVSLPGYATRCSSIVVAEPDGSGPGLGVSFREITHDSPATDRRLQLRC